VDARVRPVRVELLTQQKGHQADEWQDPSERPGSDNQGAAGAPSVAWGDVHLRQRELGDTHGAKLEGSAREIDVASTSDWCG
jgi:hypothetical protein